MLKKLAQHETNTFADSDYSFLGEANTQSLEGFLFPKTYDLIVDASADDVVRQMLDQYQVEIDTLDFSYPEQQGLTPYEPEDLQQENPYNTYLNAGLPPTPICSPSLASLQAVCNPEQTDYMYFYFVPNDQGGYDYYFSRTYEEHQQAISNAG